MKKRYSKPDIMFESFTLSTSIAGTCAHRTQDQFGCAVMFSDGSMVFTSVVSSCGVKVQADQDGDGMWGTYCYHVPTGEQVFIS